jgi:hypothetical protein
MKKIRQQFLNLFKPGKYVTTTIYSKKLKKENKIGVANVTIHHDGDNLDENISISVTHSGENNHCEKVCYHFNGSKILKVHTSNLTVSSHHGDKLYLSKNKNLISPGEGFSHIHKCYVKYKKFYSSDGNEIVVKSYIKKNYDDIFSLQSVTRFTPFKDQGSF